MIPRARLGRYASTALVRLRRGWPIGRLRLPGGGRLVCLAIVAASRRVQLRPLPAAEEQEEGRSFGVVLA